MFDITNPFSALHGAQNGATYMIMQREENITKAIHYFISLARDDFDINDKKIQREVFSRYDLQDASCTEIARIKREVEKGIK